MARRRLRETDSRVVRLRAGVAQPEDALMGIRLLISFYPAIFGIIGGLIMYFYPLTDKMMVTIEEDLTPRHGEAV